MTMRNALEGLAVESKQDDLNTLVEALNTASASILAAVQSINGKVTACNTGAVTVSNFPATQAVSIDAASLSALENVSISNFPATQPVSGTVAVSNMVGQGLTDSQLRASDVKVTLDSEAVALDAATLSALETVSVANFPATQPVSGSVSVSNMVSQGLTDSQLRATDVKVSLDGEQVAISNFPATQAVSGPITNAELRASAVPVSLDSTGMSSTDLQLEILNMLRLIKTTLNRLPFYDPTLNRGRMTAVVESGTVTTVSTVSTVTNMTNIGSYTWNAMVQMQNRSSWANNCGSRIS